MQGITPHLWFDKEAGEAAEFYTSLLEGSSVGKITTLPGTPGGDANIVPFTLAGQPFMSISAGPLIVFNPSISFLVSCTSRDEVDRLWSRLSEGGKELMPLGSYPFSQRYSWLEDRYHLSWQLMDVGDRPISRKITPTLMFVGDGCGRAEEAIEFYTALFPDAEAGEIARYGNDAAPSREGNVMHGAFNIAGQPFAAMDGAGEHNFGFNEAISFMVLCEDQQEIDRYWGALSAVPEAEQCGWCKDKFGVSWQVTPARLEDMLSGADEQQMARVVHAFMPMKKFDLATLERAYRGG